MDCFFMYVQSSISSMLPKLTFREIQARPPSAASVDAIVARRLVALPFEGIKRRCDDEDEHKDGNRPVEIIRVEACADREAAVKLAQK